MSVNRGRSPVRENSNPAAAAPAMASEIGEGLIFGYECVDRMISVLSWKSAPSRSRL